MNDLRRTVRGDVFDDSIHRRDVASDFGGLVRRTPRVVVRPLDTEDVARVVGFAAGRQVPLTTRGAGHSQGGQSLGSGGIVLDTRCLTAGGLQKVDGPAAIAAGAGTRWAEVVTRASGAGLVPPVLTNNLRASVGGTHSTGGIGTSSFRYGSQAANCLALTVVTGTGEVIRCSAVEQPDLFRHALCGLGQFGVLTAVTHALRRHRPLVHTDVAVYDDLDGFFDDLRSLAEEGRADYLDAFLVQHPRQCSWLYVLRLSSEVNDPGQLVAHRAPRAQRRFPAVCTPFADFLQSTEGQVGPAPGTGSVHPWIDVFLPWDDAATTIRAALPELPWELQCSFALRAVRPSRDRTPLLALPAGQTCLGFGVYPVVPRERAVEVGGYVDRFRERLLEGRGRSYLSGWGAFRRRDWSTHHGAAWEGMQAVKRRFDPQGILNPDISFFTAEAVQ